MAETTYEAYRPQDYSPDARRDVSIAVVSHNHLRFLDAMLRSVYGQRHRATFDLTLVDNVGQPEIAELIRDRYPQARLLVNRCRKGFAANNNMVIVGARARYAFLLNPDTELQPGALDALVDFMDAHPRAGACGPRLRYPDGRVQLSCRCFPTLGSFLVRRTPLRLVLRDSPIARGYEMADWDHESQRTVDWLFGAAILIRREALEAVGGLDEGMFMYSEDVDWCLRCHLAGWEIHYVPQAEILHHLDDHKYNSFFTRHRMMHYRTMARFVRKHWRHCLRM
ncbi:MAG: glycosyltransferase family 2 protein [Planctomycetes bacterium]|nr:glycosyltransferase family 2 protein [Planctomycetota bacterium]